jgi:hypothetical protein
MYQPHHDQQADGAYTPPQYYDPNSQYGYPPSQQQQQQPMYAERVDPYVVPSGGGVSSVGCVPSHYDGPPMESTQRFNYADGQWRDA